MLNRIVGFWLLFLVMTICIIPTLNAATYTYDELDRLVSVNYPTGQTIEYSYDETGNILSVSSSGISFEVGDIDHSGTVDLRDAVLALKISAGMNPAPVYKDTDVNNDTRIGLEEVIYALQTTANLNR